MKKSLLLLLLFSSALLSAQKKNKGKNFHWISEQDVFAVSGGQFQPDMAKFNTQLTAWGAKSVFYQGLRGYGFTAAGTFPVNRILVFDGAYAFDILLPAKVSIGTNDSLNFEMKGWRLMTSIYGKDVIPGSVVALVLAPGVDWGVLKMKRTLAGNGGLYKNGYIAPFGRAELRFVFGPIALGARGIYRFDVTKDLWKLKSGPEFVLPGTKNTGTSIEFFIGWGRVHYQ
ncbi:MAG: hypothetical protein M3R17_11195 [Bacteroidota bacterium]|nr:hypothetical protein [Bacteroidota bacterium]